MSDGQTVWRTLQVWVTGLPSYSDLSEGQRAGLDRAAVELKMVLGVADAPAVAADILGVIDALAAIRRRLERR